MSVRVMSWVWSASRSGPIQRLVLLAIADCANDTGAEAYPATSTLMKKTGLSERGVRKAVTELEALGELKVAYKAGPKGCNKYRVLMSDPAPRAGSDVDPAPNAGNPAQGAGSANTRHDVHGAPDAGSTRHVVPGTRHEMNVDPARGAPEPSLTHPPTEPSLEPSTSKRPAKVEPRRADVEQICEYLADQIEANGSKRPRITPNWRMSARLLLDTDGRTVDQVTKAIDWCQADAFWRGVIMGMPKLREKYDQLRLAAARPSGRASPGSTTDRRVSQNLSVVAAFKAKEITT